MKRLLDVSWWKRRLIELSMATLVTAAIIQIAGVIAWRQKEMTAPNAWMAIREIYVPDFPISTRPNLIYDREIRQNFNGYWIVELQRKADNGLWTTVCSGHGLNEYDPREVIPGNTVTWEWFIGHDCPIAVGSHRLKASYSMTKPGWPEKRSQAFSNEFQALPD